MVDLCFSCWPRFLLSLRLTGGGVPITARAMALTALVARKGLGFLFFGTIQEFNRNGGKERNGRKVPATLRSHTLLRHPVSHNFRA
jgi:hypothetical protein